MCDFIVCILRANKLWEHPIIGKNWDPSSDPICQSKECFLRKTYINVFGRGEERRGEERRELGHTYNTFVPAHITKTTPSTNHLLTHCLLPTQGHPFCPSLLEEEEEEEDDSNNNPWPAFCFFLSFLLSLFYDKNQSSMMSMRFSSVIEIIQLKAYMPISLATWNYLPTRSFLLL